MPVSSFSEQPLCIVSTNGTLPLDVEAYLTDCQIRNLARRTVAIYRHQLDAFLSWYGAHDTSAVTPRDVRRYMLHLQASGHNPGGQHQAYRVLRTFFRWLVAEGDLAESPMKRLQAPQVRGDPLDPVPLPDVAAMLKACEGRGLLALRDTALLLALLDTAARATELLSADGGDLDVQAGVLMLRVTKNGKARAAFLGARARRALLRYLRARGNPGPAAPLWVTDKATTRLTYWGLRQVLRRRAEQAGVPAPSAHSFRRASLLALLRDGADVFSVQKLAGHADLATTRRYLKLLQSDLAATHKAHSPADKLLG